MHRAFLSAFLGLWAIVAVAQTPADLSIDKQQNRYRQWISLGQTPVLSWSIVPEDDTLLQVTSPSSAMLDLPEGVYAVTAWTDETHGRTIVVTAGEAAAGIKASLTANPETIAKGQSSTLAWTVKGAKSVSLNGIDVAASGSQTVTPDTTTTYTLIATAGTKSVRAQRIVTVSDKPPPPPVPTTGLFVCLIEETADRSKLTADQREVITSNAAGSVRDYCNSHCAKGANGVPEFRVFDKDSKADLESQAWKDALARPRTSVPWLIVSNGKDGYDGPLPATKAETLALLRKYGGQ